MYFALCSGLLSVVRKPGCRKAKCHQDRQDDIRLADALTVFLGYEEGYSDARKQRGSVNWENTPRNRLRLHLFLTVYVELAT